jgi:hypothetical protein
MAPGKLVPEKTFTVHWKMDRCMPMGPTSVELSGNVELVVFRKVGGLSAIVTPQQLQVDSHMGRAWLHGPFTAEAELEMPVTAMRSMVARQ